MSEKILAELRAILNDCENDFHRCQRCDHQDDAATKESNLFLILKSLVEPSPSDIGREAQS